MMGYKHVDCRLPKNKKNNYEPNMIMIILENIPIWEKYVPAIYCDSQSAIKRV